MEPQKDHKVDRRVQRTQQLLNDALLSLIVEKHYDAITVQDIIDRANLGRSTFYAHYQDKDDLLQSRMDEVVHSLILGAENARTDSPGEHDSRPIFSTLPIFQHVQEQHHLHQAIFGGRGLDVVLKSIRDHLRDHIQEHIEMLQTEGQTPTVPPLVIANYLAGALVDLLTWWLDQKMPYSPERMDGIFQDLAMPGVGRTLGWQQKAD